MNQQSPGFEPGPPEFADEYDSWTRRPVVYLPVVSRGDLIGYLWAGIGSNAAGYMRRLAADPDNATCPDFWQDRLAENCRNNLTPEQVIQHWIGWPEDPRCGAIPRNDGNLFGYLWASSAEPAADYLPSRRRRACQNRRRPLAPSIVRRVRGGNATSGGDTPVPGIPA